MGNAGTDQLSARTVAGLPAGDEVVSVGSERFKDGITATANLLGERAPRVERTTSRRAENTGDLTAGRCPLAPQRRVNMRNRSHERSCVWVQRIAVQFVRGRSFYNPSHIHDCYEITGELDDGQIVGDEQIGQAEFPLQILEQIQNL